MTNATSRDLAEELREATSLVFDSNDCASMERALDRVCARVQVVIEKLERNADEPETGTDQVECLKDWAKAFERVECAKETIIDALLMAADSIKHMERRACAEPAKVREPPHCPTCDCGVPKVAVTPGTDGEVVMVDYAAEST